jgi:hypothetical protein
MTALELLNGFKKDYSSLIDEGLIITGVYGQSSLNSGDELNISIAQGAEEDEEVSPDSHHISILVPFLFDGRLLPESYQGIRLHNGYISSTVPKEIEEMVLDPAGFETSWTPNQFIQYVTNNSDLIRKEIGDPKLTLEEMLDAICFGSFLEYCKGYEEDRINRITGY